MTGVPGFIVERQLGHFKLIHPDYEAGVRAALKKAHGYEANTIALEEESTAAAE